VTTPVTALATARIYRILSAARTTAPVAAPAAEPPVA